MSLSASRSSEFNSCIAATCRFERIIVSNGHTPSRERPQEMWFLHCGSSVRGIFQAIVVAQQARTFVLSSTRSARPFRCVGYSNAGAGPDLAVRCGLAGSSSPGDSQICTYECRPARLVLETVGPAINDRAEYRASSSSVRSCCGESTERTPVFRFCNRIRMPNLVSASFRISTHRNASQTAYLKAKGSCLLCDYYRLEDSRTLEPQCRTNISWRSFLLAVGV